jgi:very-short-patch-repair endonuclease
MAKSELEETLLLFIKAEGLPIPEREYAFALEALGRRWRFDFAYPERKIGIECEGGTWAKGRHTRGSGFAKDCEKYNTAATMGWAVLRFTKDMIDNGDAIETIKEALCSD